MSNGNAAELIRLVRECYPPTCWLVNRLANLAEQQAAEIERLTNGIESNNKIAVARQGIIESLKNEMEQLKQHKSDYHDTFIDEIGRSAETLGFPLNKTDYAELRGCASADGVLAELTEKVKAEMNRLKSEVTTACGLLMEWSAKHGEDIPEPGSLTNRSRSFWNTKSPASPRPEPADWNRRVAKLSDEFRKAADIEANTPITVGAARSADLGEDSATIPTCPDCESRDQVTTGDTRDEWRCKGCGRRFCESDKAEGNYVALWRRVVQAGGVGNSETQPLERALQEVDHWQEERKQLKAEIEKLHGCLRDKEASIGSWSSRAEAAEAMLERAKSAPPATCPPMTGEQMARLWADYSGGVPESWDALSALIWPNASKDDAQVVVTRHNDSLLMMSLGDVLIYVYQRYDARWAFSHQDRCDRIFDSREAAEQAARVWLVEQALKQEQAK